MDKRKTSMVTALSTALAGWSGAAPKDMEQALCNSPVAKPLAFVISFLMKAILSAERTKKCGEISEKLFSVQFSIDKRAKLKYQIFITEFLRFRLRFFEEKRK